MPTLQLPKRSAPIVKLPPSALSQFNDKPEGGGDSANLDTTGLNHFYGIFAQYT